MAYNETWEEVERWNCRNDHCDMTDEEQDREDIAREMREQSRYDREREEGEEVE